jgi:four helix bundle protein
MENDDTCDRTCVQTIPRPLTRFAEDRVANGVSDHRQLVVWPKGTDLALHTYRLSARFPREETYGLSSQIRRAAVSVPANIAEGNGRVHRREYFNHVSVARGSLREVETLAEIGHGLGYLRREELAEFRELLDHVGRMLTRLIKRLQI